MFSPIPYFLHHYVPSGAPYSTSHLYPLFNRLWNLKKKKLIMCFTIISIYYKHLHLVFFTRQNASLWYHLCVNSTCLKNAPGYVPTFCFNGKYIYTAKKNCVLQTCLGSLNVFWWFQTSIVTSHPISLISVRRYVTKMKLVSPNNILRSVVILKHTHLAFRKPHFLLSASQYCIKEIKTEQLSF